MWVEHLARRGALGTTPSRAGSHIEWLAQPLFRSLGSPERGVSFPTSKRALKAMEEVRGHRVAEPRPCAVIGRIPITLCFRLHRPLVKDRPVGDGTAPVGYTGREPPGPPLLALSRRGPGAAAACFSVKLTGCCSRAPHTAQMMGRQVVILSQPQVLLTRVLLASPSGLSLSGSGVCC